jgi:hypothetical protein
MKAIAIFLTISSILFAAAASPISAGKMNGKPGCGKPICAVARYDQPYSVNKRKPTAPTTNTGDDPFASLILG